MEHLLTPVDASPPYIEVPLVAEIPHDSLDFLTFPSRHGFRTHKNGKISLDGLSARHVASLLQSWIYFGFLTEILGNDIRKEHFRRVHANGPTLDTSRLGELLHQRIFHKADSKFSKLYPGARKRLKRVNRWLPHVWQVVHDVARHPISGEDPLPQILFSIETLCHTLRRLIIGHTSGFAIPEYLEKESTTLASRNLIANQMIKSGWCRALVTHVSKEHDINTFYFISRVKPPEVPWINHDGCSHSLCTANHVQKAGYQNRHVTEDCGCSLLHVEGQQMTKLIDIIKRQRGVPLIKICTNSKNELELHVVEHRPGRSYVAISHVWSDGLGNPESNALPLCQMKRMRALIRQRPIQGIFPSREHKLPTLFWMDTLCIPPADRGEPLFPLRQACIDRMAFIYASAWSVLVLDHGLQQVKISTSSYEDILAQIICCAWNRRCWTLQEGALANRIFFQLADGVVALQNRSLVYIQLSRFRKRTFVHTLIKLLLGKLTSKLPTRLRRGGNALRSALQDHLLTSLRHTMKRIERPEHNDWNAQSAYTFEEAWNSLRKRSTTQPEDLFTVFANLVGFHPYLQESSHKKQLKAILLNMDKVPLSLLYNTGPKIGGETPSQRWMPATISGMALSTGAFASSMKKTPEGFVVANDASGSPDVITVSPPITRDSGPIWMLCRIPVKAGSHTRKVWLRIDLLRIYSHATYDSASFRESCILIDRFVNEAIDATPRRSWRAALLHVYDTKHEQSLEENKKTYDVIYDCPARVTIFWDRPSDMSSRKAAEDPGPSRKLRPWAGPAMPKKMNPETDSGDEEAIMKQPPWRLGGFQAHKVLIPRASVTQDDSCFDLRRSSLSPFGSGSHRGVIIDQRYTIHFPKQWKLLLETPDARMPVRLQKRPYPIFNFMHTKPDALLYAARLIGMIAPLICIAMICVFLDPLLEKPDENWIWKFILAAHGAHIVLNILTLKISNGLLFAVLVTFHGIVAILFPVVCSTIFLFASMLEKDLRFDISNLEKFVAIVPYAVTTLWTLILGAFFKKVLMYRAYKYWLLTFDKEWQPEKTRFWWRPSVVRRWMTRNRGQGTV